MSTHALKPCPFCGQRKLNIELLGTAERPFHVVICENCEAEGPIARTEARAVDAWNTRRRPQHDGH